MSSSNEVSIYYDAAYMERTTYGGGHRGVIGGMWDEIGRLQFDFMVQRGGLTPDMRLLDLGCGCFRGGVHFIPYLKPDHYYGLDMSAPLLEAGFREELPKYGLAGKLRPDHVLARSDFDASAFGVAFDRILAVSLWTHLTLNHIQRSLREVARVLAPGGIFYVTAFLCPDGTDPLGVLQHPRGGVRTHRDQDPYHQRLDDFGFLIRQLGLPLEMSLVGDWNHPRDQQMLAFRRI